MNFFIFNNRGWFNGIELDVFLLVFLDVNYIIIRKVIMYGEWFEIVVIKVGNVNISFNLKKICFVLIKVVVI